MEAGGYNLFAFGDVSRTGADAQGWVAVGGSATLTNFGVNSRGTADGPAANALVVGGSLTATNGEIQYGSGVVAGAIVQANFGHPNGTLTGGIGVAGLPINFVAARADLTAKSASYAALAATGTVANTFGTLNLTGTNVGLNVFALGGSQLSGLNGLNITAPAGSTVLVNVAGNPGAFTGYGQQLNGVGGDHVLFNFADATALTVSGFSLRGSVLAPRAALDLTNGNIEGNVVVGSVLAGSSGEFHTFDNAGRPTLFAGRLSASDPGAGTGGGNPVPAPPGAVLGLVAAACGWRWLRRA